MASIACEDATIPTVDFVATGSVGRAASHAWARVAPSHAVRSALSAIELVARVDAFLAQEPDPELARLKPIFAPCDLEPDRMPDFMLAYLQHIWAGEG